MRHLKQGYFLIFVLMAMISSLIAQTNKNIGTSKEQIRNIEKKMSALPRHEKKLNSLHLDKVNKMTADNAINTLSGDKIAKRYTSSITKVDNEGRIYVKS